MHIIRSKLIHIADTNIVDHISDSNIVEHQQIHTKRWQFDFGLILIHTPDTNISEPQKTPAKQIRQNARTCARRPLAEVLRTEGPKSPSTTRNHDTDKNNNTRQHQH